MSEFSDRIKAVWRGGVNPPHHKNTMDSETVFMPVPKKVIIPMRQHSGAECTPLVKRGDSVLVGQKIGDSDERVCAPIHSPVSGTVTALSPVLLPDGTNTAAVVIEADGEQKMHESVAPPKVESYEDFIKAVRESGLVGLGGAGFPTHVKLKPNNGAVVDTLIINAAECEPFITSDYRECMEMTSDILSGIDTVAGFLNLKRVYIAIEDNKPAALERLRGAVSELSGLGYELIVKVLKTRYPQGAEKVIIKSVTGKEVPQGKLPADVGVLVMNVTSVAFVARYLKTGVPLISRRITVDGGAVASPQNVHVLLGTPISDVIEFCKGYKTAPFKLLMGGPMMGTALANDELPVIKQNNAILAFDEEQAWVFEITNCISCGRCVRACPVRIMPVTIEQAVIREDLDDLAALDVNTCIECGCCTFVCPARRQLAQSMRLGKAMLERAAEKKSKI